MIETSLLAGPLVESATQQQSLPSAQQHDVSRFQDLMTGNGAEASTAIQPQSVDSASVLQLVEPGQSVESSPGLMDSLINQATNIDGNYHSLIEEMANRPSFDEYFSPRASADEPDGIMTYPSVPVDTNSDSAAPTMGNMLESMKENSQASLAYQSDMNDWSMNFRMWSAGVEVVSAAASKVSQGFQTLFRASG